MSKPKIGLLYRKNHYAFTGNYFDNTFYNFLFKALNRVELADVIYIPKEEVFDYKEYEGKIDALILFDPTPKGCPKEIRNLDLFKGPKFFHAVDAHHALTVIEGRRRIDYYRDLNLTEAFTHHNLLYFRKFYPEDEFNHYHIFPGFETTQYENLPAFEKRINDRVLITGAMSTGFYQLRRKIATHPKVIHIGSSAGFVNDRFPLLLSKYRASVAAAGFSLVMKFIEVPAAGCLTFFGKTPTNELHSLGIIDGQHGIIVDELNYSSKLDEYINTKNDPKWAKIANTGKKYFWENYTNDAQAKKLLGHIIEKI